MFRKYRFTFFVLVLGLLLLASVPGWARPVVQQAAVSDCTTLVERALTELGQNCSALDRNAACYGFNRVDAAFNSAVADDFFSRVADRAPLTNLDSIYTAPLDVNGEVWGVAVLNVMANVPNSLPGQAVTFILLGDAQMRNDVSPDAAFIPADPLPGTARGAVNLRSGPGTNFNVIASVNDGTDLPIEGRSADGAWLRTLINDRPAWVSADLVQVVGAVSQLPVINAENRSPMQAFYLTTGLGAPDCEQAPDALLIQGPQTMTVRLTVNGTDITIGSTVVIGSTAILIGDLFDDPLLVEQFGAALGGSNLAPDTKCSIVEIIVLDGQADLNDGGLTLPTGFVASMLECGGADKTSQFQSGWSGSRPMTPEERRLLALLINLPAGADLPLRYPVTIPTDEDIAQSQQTFSGGGGSTSAGASGPAAGRLQCGTLRPTSPLGTMPQGPVTFYWDGVPGATSYVVYAYNDAGANVSSFATGGAETNVVGDPAAQGVVSWDVAALINGQEACRSARAVTQRDAPSGYVNTCINTFITPCTAPCVQGAPCPGFPGKTFICSCPP